MQNLLTKANKVYLKNFEPNTWFERAIFFSWYCSVGDCSYCYMSTQPKEVKEGKKFARRSTESILAEVILCKKFGWNFCFLSGGQKAYTTLEFENLLKNVHKVYGRKVWINIGALTYAKLKKFSPHIKGVVAAIETINPKIHEKVCPSKPIKPMIQMLKNAEKLNLKKAITIILGLGETKKDFPKLKNFIKENKISKIHFYSLNPQKGTKFENAKPPSKHYQSWWIAKTRINFPKMDIQAGIWKNRTNTVSCLLKAGANSISKFPAIKSFNTKNAKQIEEESAKAGRKFVGTLTKKVSVSLAEVEKLKIGENLKIGVKNKLKQYLKSIS